MIWPHNFISNHILCYFSFLLYHQYVFNYIITFDFVFYITFQCVFSYAFLQKHNLRYNYLLYYLLITPFYDALNHLVFSYFVQLH